MIERILVLGGGSAGFLAAISMKTKVPELAVTVVRSPEIAVIGVGESTTFAVPNHLHGFLGIGMPEFYRGAEPQWKLGIRFRNWGQRPYFDYVFSKQMAVQHRGLRKEAGFYCEDGALDYLGISSAMMTHNGVFVRHPSGLPQITSDTAYHIENVKFVAFLEGYARQLGVEIRDDTMKEAFQNEHGITGLRLASGVTVDADLFVDCSGFASLLLGKALGVPFVSYQSSLFCDRAVVGTWQRDEHEPILPYTTAEGMNAGWCWQIEHEFHINRGYVYSSAFISDSDAEAEYLAKNPKAQGIWRVKFRSGRYEDCWVNNVIGIGNSSGFVEPLESTALGVICAQCSALAESLLDSDCRLNEALRRQYNKGNAAAWDHIRGFLAIHYKFNTYFDTPFWRECRAKTDLAGSVEILDFYEANGPTTLCEQTLIDKQCPFTMEGYLCMLVGQQVPHRRTFVPSVAENETWQRIQTNIKQQALRAFTIPEALRTIRSPYWMWPTQLHSPTFAGILR